MTQAIFLIPLILDSEQFEDVLYANIDLNDVKNLSKIAKSLQIILRVKSKESSRKTKKNHKSSNWVAIQVSVEL